jgi:hypothetical protein
VIGAGVVLALLIRTVITFINQRHGNVGAKKGD